MLIGKKYKIESDELNITLYQKYISTKGKKFISVVLVRSTTKNVEHKLCGREWWINLLDKLGLIRKLPKPPKDVHLYTSD